MNAIEILGLDIKLKKWDKHDSLPIYITEALTIQRATISNIDCLMITFIEDLPNIQTLKKYIERIQNIDNLPVFLYIEKISEFKKKNLLSNHIPFIYLNKQVYLPFLYTFLTSSKVLEINKTDKLTKSAQLLLIWILYQKNNRYYVSEAISKLRFSNMTLTRAYRQLVGTGLFSEHKDGRKIFLTSKLSKKELFNQIKSYLQSPVIKEGYINKDEKLDLVLSGESLLSELSMLNPPKVSEYAIYQKDIDKSIIYDELIDEEKQIKVQVWNYDPLLFSSDKKTIDVISLITTFLDNEDERIEMILDELIEKYEVKN